MPKILINEIDRTSAGTPGEYSNNSVLICGFAQRTNEEIIAAVEADPAIGYTLPDDNGIFEFYSYSDFESTIGKVAPVLIEGANVPAHYGNQMAYELLKQGYPSVIYISLGKVPSTNEEITKALRKISDAANWEIFKDRASYDFRFITHGLLTSCKTHDIELAEIAVTEAEKALEEAEAALEAAEKVLTDATAKLETAEADKKALEDSEDYIKTSPEAVAAEKAVDAAEEAVTAAEKNVAEAQKAVDVATTALNVAEDNLTHATDSPEACFTEKDFADANKAIADLATYIKPGEGDDPYEPKFGSGRGDCVALIEIDESKYVNSEGGRPEAKILAAAEKMGDVITGVTGTYCACTVPSVIYRMTADPKYGNNKKFPGAFHYLACYKRMIDANFSEWYAAAGYTRGVASYTIDYTTVKLGEIAIQALEPRYKRGAPYNYAMPFAVNVIANFRGSYYLWGNRTCHLLGDYAGGNDLTAQHFLNIRQLCTTIKKQLYVSCRRFTFDPNSDVLWINFKNSIIPTLDRMKADQGIRDYKIEKVYTDKKATLRARIRIVPIEAVEDFVIELSLEDSLGEVELTVTE
jgi:hypothetical protein